MTDTWIDGNALGGPMREVFSVDVTTAMCRCANCGRTGPLAETRLFDHAPGMVARCPSCDGIVMRMVRGPGRAWLDLRGASYLQLPMPDES
jgi:NAD-dependent SIR2 family protein deacetylase